MSEKLMNAFENEFPDRFFQAGIAEANMMGMAAGMTILLVLSGFRVSEGTMSIGAFTAVNLYMMQLFQPLNFLGSVYREIRQALIDMENMFNLLDEKPNIQNHGSEILLEEKSEIEFNNVKFGYDERRQILKGISFNLLSSIGLTPTGHHQTSI